MKEIDMAKQICVGLAVKDSRRSKELLACRMEPSA
jgi:hypothetical protein